MMFEMRIGDRAYMHSMVRDFHHMNHKACVLVDFDTIKQRWRVRVVHTSSTLWIKEKFLSPFFGRSTVVVLRSLVNDNGVEELKKTRGIIVERDSCNDEWTFRTRTGFLVTARAEDLCPVFHIGAHVVIVSHCGADNLSQYHRRPAIISAYNLLTERWVLIFESQEPGVGTDISVTADAWELSSYNIASLPVVGDLVILDREKAVDGSIRKEQQVEITGRDSCLYTWSVVGEDGVVMTRTLQDFRTEQEDMLHDAYKICMVVQDTVMDFTTLMKIAKYHDGSARYDHADRVSVKSMDLWRDKEFLALAFCTRQCHCCDKLMHKKQALNKCARCKSSYYCDRVCQRKHWVCAVNAPEPSHRTVCAARGWIYGHIHPNDLPLALGNIQIGVGRGGYGRAPAGTHTVPHEKYYVGRGVGQGIRRGITTSLDPSGCPERPGVIIRDSLCEKRMTQIANLVMNMLAIMSTGNHNDNCEITDTTQNHVSDYLASIGTCEDLVFCAVRHTGFMILVPLPMSVFSKINPTESLHQTTPSGHIRCAVVVDVTDDVGAASYKVLMRYLRVLPRQ
jgi:hypothetical protein